MGTGLGKWGDFAVVDLLEITEYFCEETQI